MRKLLANCSNLSDCEIILQNQVSRHRLLGQVDFSTKDFARLQKLVKQSISLEGGKDFKELRKKYPCCLAYFMVWVAIRYYAHGEYWPHLFKYCELINSSPLQSTFGKFIKNFLKMYDLPQFYFEGSLSVLTPILCHACIPDYCCPDFFNNFIAGQINFCHSFGEHNYDNVVSQWLENNSTVIASDKPIYYFLKSQIPEVRALIIEFINNIKLSQISNSYMDKEKNVPQRLYKLYEKWKNGELPNVIKPIENNQIKERIPEPYLAYDPVQARLKIVIPKMTIAKWQVENGLHVEIRTNTGKTLILEDLTFEYHHDVIQTKLIKYELNELSESYGVFIKSGQKNINIAFCQAISKNDLFIAFVENKDNYILATEDPEPGFWLITKSGGKATEEFIQGHFQKVPIIHGALRGYTAWYIDKFVSAINFTYENDVKTFSLASKKQVSAKLCEMPLQGITCEGADVYCKFPWLQIDDLNQLDIRSLSIQIRSISQNNIIRKVKSTDLYQAYNSNAKINLKKYVKSYHRNGTFEVSIEQHDNITKTIIFTVIEHLNVEFQPQFICPLDDEKEAKEKVHVTLSIPNDVTITSSNAICTQTKEKWILEYSRALPELKCVIDFDESSNLSLSILTPIVRSAYSENDKLPYAADFSNTSPKISIDQFRSATKPALFLQFPFKSINDLELIYSNMHNAWSTNAKILEQDIYKFDLAAFKNILINSKEQNYELAIKFKFPSSTKPKFVKVVTIEQSWKVTDPIFDETKGFNIVKLEWQEQNAPAQKLVRIWNRCRPWDAPKTFSVESRVNNIHIANKDLPNAGFYRVQFEEYDEWNDTTSNYAMPKYRDGYIFDLQIGSISKLDAHACMLSASSSLLDKFELLLIDLIRQKQIYSLNNYSLSAVSSQEEQCARHLVSENMTDIAASSAKLKELFMSITAPINQSIPSSHSEEITSTLTKLSSVINQSISLPAPSNLDEWNDYLGSLTGKKIKLNAAGIGEYQGIDNEGHHVIKFEDTIVRRLKLTQSDLELISQDERLSKYKTIAPKSVKKKK